MPHFEAIGAGEAGKEALDNELRQLYSTAPPTVHAELRVMEEPRHSLRDGYSAAGLLEEAKASYQRAVELAESTDDPGLQMFQANLECATEAAPDVD